MGFFKKIIRKVTKPISKVLDKVVPNEIKPLLPYAAAFAPYLLPAGAGLGALGGSLNPMIQRAILTGGLNLGSQLAQEGSEGDFNAMSLGLASLQGAMGATGAADKFKGMTTQGGLDAAGTTGMQADRVMEGRNLFTKAKDMGLGALAKGSEFVGEAGSILRPGGTPLTMSNAITAAGIPFSQGTGDAMAFEANAAMKEYERALADYNEQQGALGTDAGRREAILAAMQAYNHPEELIESTLAELGLRNGGRVGLEFGGIPAAVQNVADKQLTSNLETAQDMQMPIEDLVQEFIELKKRKPNNYDELMDFYRQKYGTGSKISSMTEEMTEEFAANGGIMGRQGYISGGAIKGGLKAIMGMGDEVVDLSKQKEVFRDGPITADFLQTVDKSIIDPAIRSRDTMGPGGYGMYNNLAEMPAGLQAAELISRIRKPGGGIDYEKAEMFIGKKLKGNETIDELIAMIVKPQRAQKAADGGIMEYNMGGSVLPDGIEMDYRGGGFIPMGSKERADDVPARVSKNEFVMTADAVRAAGGGSVNKGAKRMYELMNKLEARA